MALNPSAPDQSGADPHRDGFDEARRDLLMADSPSERAMAAHKLGLLGNAAGVAYLIAALYDSEAEVRNAAAESLGAIGDAAALGPLTDLQERAGTESDTVIANAIRLISSRQKDYDHWLTSIPGASVSNNESAAFELDLDLAREEGGNSIPQRQTETKVNTNNLNEAVAEIDAILKAQSQPAARIQAARDKHTASNSAFVIEQHTEAPELIGRTTIRDEIDAGFEHLRQAEARQARLIAAAEDRLREQQEARHKIECSIRQRAEEEKRLAEEIEALQVAERKVVKRIREAEGRRRVQYEAVRRTEIEMRARAEEERRRLAELEEKRHHAEEETRKRSEQEQQLQISIDLLAQAVTEQNNRIAEAEAQMAETLRTLKADEQRHAAEAQAALELHEEMRKQAAAELQQRSEQAQRLTDEIKSLQGSAEEQAKRISECEAEVVRAQATALAQAEAEARLLKKVERLQLEEAEARRLAAAEANERAAANLRNQAEAEERRLAELAELHHKAEVEAQERANREAELTRQFETLAQEEQEQTKRLQTVEKSLQTKKELLGQIESRLERLTENDAQRSSQIASLQKTLQQVQAESQLRTKEEEELAELRRKTEAELSQRKELAQQLSSELEALRATSQSYLKAVTELESSVQQARGEAQELSRREANVNQQLRSLTKDVQKSRKRLQAAETSLQRQQETCKQVELEYQQLAATEEELMAGLSATREQATEEGQRRAAKEAKLNKELDALRATAEKQLKAISELEASVQRAQGEIQQRSARQAELKQQLSNLAKDEQKLRKQLQKTETSLQLQQETQKQLEIEYQQRTEAEEEQIARLATTREQLAEEGQRRAMLEQQLSAELAAFRSAEENQLKVIKKLEVNVQQTRAETEQLIAREAQLNTEIQTLVAMLASQHESQAAAAARRVEQEDSLREMDAATRLLTDDQEVMRTEQLQALHHHLESESQQRLEDERQLNLAIEALRVEETEHRARLEELRKHTATLEEAKRLRMIEESNISAEIAALEASISRAEEPRPTEWLDLTSEHETSYEEVSHLPHSPQAEVELFVPLEPGIDPETRQSEVVEISVYEVTNDGSAPDVEPLIVSRDSFSFGLSSPAVNHQEEIAIGDADFETSAASPEQVKLTELEPITASVEADDDAKSLSLVTGETGLTQANQDSPLSQAAARLGSADPAARCEALMELSKLGGEESFDLIANRFDDAAVQVRNAAARALCEMQGDRAASLTRALREAQPERRRRIGAAFAGSGLAAQAINCLAGESREVTYDAFTTLFLMAKAGEVQPLIDTIESHANIAVRLAVIKLLAFSNQADVVAAFRRLAVRASLPAEVRSAVMEAIHDITTPSRDSRISAA